MKNKRMILTISACALLLTACGNWTSIEPNDYEPDHSTQGHSDYAAYTAALREYKASNHMLTYARLNNAPARATSEKDFMRSLPDSLDMVSLTNADNLSQFDIDDMELMRQKGTKVFYRVDFMGRLDELSDAEKLGAYLDRVMVDAARYGFDGYAFTGAPKVGEAFRTEAAALIVARLSADEERLLVLEGNPLFVAKADRAKVDYYVLNTEALKSIADVKQAVSQATGYAAIAAQKVLLTASVGVLLTDEDNVQQSALTELSTRVRPFGLKGLAVFNISGDYYSGGLNYLETRNAINLLNGKK